MREKRLAWLFFMTKLLAGIRKFVMFPKPFCIDYPDYRVMRQLSFPEELVFCDRALVVTILILILTSLACNAFAGRMEPLPPPPTAVVDERPAAATAEPVATATLSSLSPISAGRVTILVDLNIRSGPGVEYDRVGFLLAGESVPVVGVNSDTGWWKIECPDIISESECWVSGGEQFTRAEGIVHGN